MHKAILAILIPLSAPSASAAHQPEPVPIIGSVTQECAVAVEVKPFLYSLATQRRDDALRSELRVRDSNGRDIPYAFRAAKTRVVDEANHSVSFVAAPPMEVLTACTVETDARAKKTVIEVSAYGMPVTAVGVNATDRNFSRAASVFRRMDGRWHHLASGRISAVNLPGEKRRSLEIGFGREVRESELRIEIGNDDNPPLSLDDLPVSFKVTRYDVVFIAEPDESYSLVVVNGAERPRYDEAILGYIDRVQDPVRFEIKLPLYDGVDVLNGANGPTAVWLSIPSRVIIQIVSAIVFIVLGIICFRLFKSTSADGT